MGSIEVGSTQKAGMHRGPAPGGVTMGDQVLLSFSVQAQDWGLLSSQQLPKTPGGSRTNEPCVWKRVGWGWSRSKDLTSTSPGVHRSQTALQPLNLGMELKADSTGGGGQC